jgi:hypothetical protein
MVFSNNLLMGAGGQASGYEIDQSIRFNRNDDAKLTRTFGTATNRRKFTLSVWQKNGSSAGSMLEYNATGGVTWANITIGAGGRVDFFDYSGGSARIDLRTSRVFRDPAAWVHLVVAVDTTQSTAANRVKVYINGSQQTDFGTETYPSQNFDGFLNSGVEHLIGEGVNGPFDGYIAEYYFIDGQQLAPTSFGETSSSTGQWIPIDASDLTFGTNGFYLKGQDSSALGDDSSGNGNDFTSSGLTTADQVSDSPTDNFSTFSPIGSCNVSGQALTISDGNLRSSAGGTSNAIEAISTIAPTTGKYYAEFTLNANPQLSNQYPAIGIIGIDLNITGGNNLGGSTFFGYLPSGVKKNAGSDTSYGDSFTNGDIIGIALDLDNQKIYFSKNGTYQNSGDPAAGSNAAFTNLVAGTEYRFCVSHAGSSATDVTMNAGQSSFNTAAPTGFSPMSTANLPSPTIADPSAYFQPTVYTGNGTAIGSGGKAVTQVGSSTFQPDLVWIKCFTTGNEHDLYDAVRGTTKVVFSSATNTESTQSEGLTTFGSSGFTVGNRGEVNTNATDHVAWQWKANGSGSSNTDGSVTSTVSANTTAGFSICKLNPGGNSNITFGHGLGVAPSVVMVKNLEDATNWQVLSTEIGVGNKIFLNATNAAASDANMWQNTAPTSTVVSMGTAQTSDEEVIAYCFAEVEGYSKFGSYEGNNNATDGPFIYVGFKPRLVMCKRYDGADGWTVLDTSRGSANFGAAAGTGGDDPTAGNFMNTQLNWNTNGANEDNAAGSRKATFTSTGFKVRNTNTAMNASGGDYFYMAFAESPFKTATAR